VKYERELWHFVQGYLNPFQINKYKSNTNIPPVTDCNELNSKLIFSRFEGLHSKYLKEEPSFEVDLRYCIEASAEMLEMTFYASALTENEQKQSGCWCFSAFDMACISQHIPDYDILSTHHPV
jgi:hypothetical protein